MKKPCPQCGTLVDWNEKAEWRPFCSERCRLIDLGAWFSEENSIPGEPVDPQDIGDGMNSGMAGNQGDQQD